MSWSRSARPSFVRSAFVDRLRLRRAALWYAEHNWAVVPGGRFTGSRFDCERAGCPTTGCHPAVETWERQASVDCARVAGWWRHQPHAVLLTGQELVHHFFISIRAHVREKRFLLGRGGRDPDQIEINAPQQRGPVRPTNRR